MVQALVEVISPAVGIMISPFPIVGLILILMSNKARRNSLAYMLGWIFGIGLVFTLALLFVDAGVAAQEDPGWLKRLIFIILGALMLWFAWREFQKRPKEGEQAKVPTWFAKLNTISVPGAAGFGFLLSALNPKNLLLALGAGASVGMHMLSIEENLIVALVFTILASLAIIVPTLLFLFLGDRMKKVLAAMEQFLIQNNAVITALLLLMIGLNMIGKAF